MSMIPACLPVNAFTTISERAAPPRRFYSTISLPRSRTVHSDEARAIWSAPMTSIPLLREAINSLDTTMASLMNHRHELETHLEQAVRLQSPVSRLPSELLSTIFLMGVMGRGDVMVSTLMLVCRCWSEVALTTPALWAKISVGPHDSFEKAQRKLERSKSCPLDISINFEPRLEFTSSVTEHVTRAMDLIRPALWRTKSFRLCVPNRPQAHAALLRCQEEAPLLETLVIHVHHSMQEDTYSTPILPLFKGHTPRLQSCSLTSFNFGWDHRLISNLRVLKLGGYFNSFTPSGSILLGILQQCPDLEELALRNMSSVESDICRPGDFVPPPYSKLIQLRRLTKISFYYSGIALTRTIMSHIAFPELESLELCYLENVTPVLQLLYAQALTHLRIESCLLNEVKFINFLRRVPTLSSLDLIDIQDTSSGFFKGLSSSQPWICPRLEALSLDGCTSFDWDSLRGFVYSRLPSIPHTHTPYPPATEASCLNLPACRNRALSQDDSPPSLLAPRRLHAIDVTRCSQISQEMVQWLRMYVSDVKCVWGEQNC